MSLAYITWETISLDGFLCEYRRKRLEKLENPNFGLTQYQSGTGVLEITLLVPKMDQTYICLSNEMMYMEHTWCTCDHYERS